MGEERSIVMSQNLEQENLKNEINLFQNNRQLSLELFASLMTTDKEDVLTSLQSAAQTVRKEVFQNKVYIRGLIEFTNYCRNNCYYCGIRRDNANVQRYRLTKEDILSCCDRGYALGFRTFVLQGGEDLSYSDDKICAIVSAIKDKYSDCAVTLSIGEKSKESYKKYFDAGATRYLLRHETANEAHYGLLHPKELTLLERKRCLLDLKEIGYQVGCGFMVGSPYQTIEMLYEDLQFIRELEPHMVGIGPFIPQKDTPFGNQKAGTSDATIRLLSILRIMQPTLLLPATTALGTLEEDGRERGILAGANVVMPNLSPDFAKEKYCLYDKKIHSGSEAAEGVELLKQRMKKIGYEVVTKCGDSPVWKYA